MYYKVHTSSNNYEGFIVQADTPEEAEDKVSNGSYIEKAYTDYDDWEINDTEELSDYTPPQSDENILDKLQELEKQAQKLNNIRKILNS